MSGAGLREQAAAFSRNLWIQNIQKSF